mmetsp:Transcript_52630/g.104474  ORF Transcript_52630/g.104474 Transcript_52630/m.104474 type:complete len:579 (-) Transcript_52630:37-1773(-)
MHEGRYCAHCKTGQLIPPVVNPLTTLPPVAASPRQATPPFVRAARQKLSADSARAGRPILERPTINADSALRTADLLLLEKGRTGADAVHPLPNDVCLVKDRCFLNGFLTHDLERYRAAFAEELRAKLEAVQEALKCTDVTTLVQQVTRRLDAIQALGHLELEQLRNQCKELLRLNTQLRQQQLDTNMEHMTRTSERISSMVDTLNDVGGIDMTPITKAIVSAMEPIREGQQNIQARMERLEAQNAELTTEFRTALHGELAPLNQGQEAMRARIRRIEDLGLEALKQESFAREKLQQIAETQGKRALAASGTAGGVQGVPVSPRSPVPGAAVDATTASPVLKALRQELLDMLSQDCPPAVAAVLTVALEAAEDRTKLFSNQGKMALNQSDIQKGIQQLEASLAEVRGDVSEMSNAIEGVPVREEELAELRKKVGEQGSQMSIVPFLKKIRSIEQRGNLRIDLKSGEVALEKEIKFKGKKASEEPEAEIVSDSEALEILTDVAELWANFKVDMVIEGHTKGGENEFWQKLATNRANWVAAKLMEMGVDKEKIHPEGLPGKLGKNIVAVDVKLDIFPEFA